LAIEKWSIPLLSSHTAGNLRSIHPHDLEKTQFIFTRAYILWTFLPNIAIINY